MAKKKKNGNYVTEKTVAARAEASAAAAKKKNKKIAKIVITAVAIVLAVAAAVVLIGFAFGLFNYYPTATEHVEIELEGYGTLHIELYGNDAPETVKKFLSLAESGNYNNRYFSTFVNDLLYASGPLAASGATGIKGEFSANGINNKVMHRRGTLSMARGEGNDSASGQFFIVTKDSPELNGKYAAFGMITDGMDVIDKIVKEAKPGANGELPFEGRVIIKSVSSHESH